MTRKEPHEKRTGDILDAAVAEFVEKGYENTSVESIARRAGLTKGGLYHHFGSKDEILMKANARFSEPIEKIAREAFADKSPSHGLKRYISSYLSWWSEHERELTFIFLSLTKAVSDSKLRGIYEGYDEEVAGFLAELYRAGIRKGEFTDFDPRPVSRALYAALDGILCYIILSPDLTAEKAASDLCTSFITPYKNGKKQS